MDRPRRRVENFEVMVQLFVHAYIFTFFMAIFFSVLADCKYREVSFRIPQMRT